MSDIVLTEQQATQPEALPRRCLRCNKPSREVVSRPIEEMSSAGSSSWGRRSTSPRSGGDVWQGLGLSFVAVELIVTALGYLARRSGWAGKALWLAVLLSGVGALVQGVALLTGYRTPEPFQWVLLPCLLFSVVVTAWVAGKVERPAGEGASALIPVCAQHKGHWQAYQRVMVGVSLGAALYLAALAVAAVRWGGNPLDINSSALNWLGGGLLVLMALLGLAHFLFPPPIRVVRSGAQQVTVKGVASDYRPGPAPLPSDTACGG